MKNKVFVSNHGEIFEGTQAELCKAKGIKQRNGFNRATGAVDAEGDRWLEEGKEFVKPNLYLGPRRETSKGPDGKPQTVWVAHCDTAGAYNGAKEALERGGNWQWHRYALNAAPEVSEDDVVRYNYKSGVMHVRGAWKPFSEDMIESFKECISIVESKYTIIDNKEVVFDKNKPLEEQLDDINREWNEAHDFLEKIVKDGEVKSRYWAVNSRIYDLDQARLRVVVRMLQKARKEGLIDNTPEGRNEAGVKFQTEAIAASKARIS